MSHRIYRLDAQIFEHIVIYMPYMILQNMLDHKQVGWDTVAAGMAISFVTFVKIPIIPPQTLAMVIGGVAAIFLPAGFGFGPEIFRFRV